MCVPTAKPSPLFSTPVLARAGLRIHTEHHIVICVSCGLAWRPTNVIGHIKRAHHVNMNKGDETEIMSSINHHGITDESLVATPTPKMAPVELIRVEQDGFCCNLCQYCCRSRRTFDNHWSSNHREPFTNTNERFHKGEIQTFFDPVPVNFFEVSICLQQVPVGSAFDIYVKKEHPTHTAFQPTIPLKDREIPPFLHVTQWHTHLGEYITNVVTRKALRDIIRLPKKLQQDDLHSVVIKYMKTISDRSSQLAYQLRCLLIECPRFVLRAIQCKINANNHVEYQKTLPHGSIFLTQRPSENIAIHSTVSQRLFCPHLINPILCTSFPSQKRFQGTHKLFSKHCQTSLQISWIDFMTSYSHCCLFGHCTVHLTASGMSHWSAGFRFTAFMMTETSWHPPKSLKCLPRWNITVGVLFFTTALKMWTNLKMISPSMCFLMLY